MEQASSFPARHCEAGKEEVAGEAGHPPPVMRIIVSQAEDDWQVATVSCRQTCRGMQNRNTIMRQA